MDWLLAGLTLKDRISESDSNARDARIPNLKDPHLSTLGTFPFLGCSFLGLDRNLSLCSCTFRDSLSEKRAAPWTQAEKKA